MAFRFVRIVISTGHCYTEGMQRKTFRYRLSPTPAQETALQRTLDECRWLYNRLLVHNHCLAKSITDAAWSAFTEHLMYKAASAGRQVVTVNPAYTSQECSSCHHRQQMPPSERVYRCPCCGLELDRDHNAALNILAVGLHSLAHA
jgi:transposase